MANTLLTPTMITREALRILHEDLNFIGNVQRQYDSRFAKSGAKIGDALEIRKPPRYTVRTGKVASTQDSEEEKTTLTVATQKGVDLSFSSAERAMDIDDFADRFLKPAMAVLASDLEYSFLQSVTKDVYTSVGTPGTTPNAFLTFGEARARLNQNLAPKDDNRCVLLDSIAMAQMVDTGKALFHDSTEVKKSYRKGIIGQAAGFKWMENDRIYTHTTGSDHTTVTVNDTVASGDSVITLAGGTLSVGTIFTIANVKAVHGETKQAYEHNQQFVVTAVNGNDYSVSPSFISTGAKQNINALPANSAVVTALGSASTNYPQHLAFHKEAFAWASADLPLPGGTDMAAREVFDGISMRMVSDYDVTNDDFITRFDVLHGYTTLRPEFAVRITG